MISRPWEELTVNAMRPDATQPYPLDAIVAEPLTPAEVGLDASREEDE